MSPPSPTTGTSAPTRCAELTSDPESVREWLAGNHRKQLAVLDKFLLELRLGRRAASSYSVSSAATSAASTPQPNLHLESLPVALRTVDVLRHLVGSTRWKSAAQLLVLLRGLGRLFQASDPHRPELGNLVRRVMAAVREETLRDASTTAGSSSTTPDAAATTNPDRAPTAAAAAASGGRLSLQSMLWALPQHVKSKPSFGGTRGDHQRQESFGSGTDLLDSEYPSPFYSTRPDLKQAIMEAIQEIMTELEDVHRNINEQATNHIHADEIILTCGRSRTIEEFLKCAAAKHRKFQVLVCEGAPHGGGRDQAYRLAQAGIDTVAIHDSALFALMPRVNKVLLPAHAVLANGGLVADSGCNVVALAAHHNSVPVVCVSGLFKLCPLFPHEGQDTLNDLRSPCSVLGLHELRDPLLRDVEFLNPARDYLKPEHINLYITNVGSFQPSFTYRLLAEYYHVDDWEPFD